MAARNLALNLQKSLRGRAAIAQLKQGQANPKGLTRSFATPVSHGAKTECTTLSNGFTVS
jgi:processing peptidase subunit beta